MIERHRGQRVLSGVGWCVCGAVVAGWGATGCGMNDPAYFPVDGPVMLQVDGMGMQATATIPLRFRAPGDADRTALQQMSANLGYDAPWLREDRVHVEVRYTVINLGDQQGQFSLFVDGASEFERFDYQAVAAAFDMANQDAPPVGLIQVTNPPLLAPGQSIQGTIREDDFHEASIDLDAMGRFMGQFVALLINRSEVSLASAECLNPDPATRQCGGLEMTPPELTPPKPWVLPALWEITPRFNADQPMSCQILIRVRDDNGQLWENGDAEFMPMPATFTPMVPPRP